MYETLEMMKSIITGKEKGKSEKELIIEYKKKLTPNILAYFYQNNFGIIKRIRTLFPILSDEDVASFCLQELDLSLQDFNFEKNVKFITYFSKRLKNRLRMEIEQLQTQKRKLNINCISYENLLENNYDIEDLSNNYISSDLLFDQYNLTEKERNYCKLRLLGYSFREIGKLLKINYQKPYKEMQIIKEKILLN